MPGHFSSPPYGGSPYDSTATPQTFHYSERTPSATPSPRGPLYSYPPPPQRSATRNDGRRGSTGFGENYSPRYNSQGHYATAHVSSSRAPRKHDQQWASPRSERKRRSSYSYYRASDSHGESDEDEIIEIDGITYVWPARSKFKKYNDRDRRDYDYRAGGYGTDPPRYSQTQSRPPAFIGRESYTRSPEPKQSGHRRRSSTSTPKPTPQRPATARPASSHRKTAPPPAKAAATERPVATAADALKHCIPPNFSLKNWDPSEEPITLLGSVFDANSLGKWVYDWTVYTHGGGTPISDMAGDLWLLLIQLFGKVRRAEEVYSRIRRKENKEIMDDFLESGDRLASKLRALLKLCESPMLKVNKRGDTQLPRNSGVEFVKTLFGHERELDRTERFMQSVRLWNLRYDANCEEIIRDPFA
jgi:hypothetical protein